MRLGDRYEQHTLAGVTSAAEVQAEMPGQLHLDDAPIDPA